MVRVRGRGGDPRRERARLGDALLEHLALLVLAVEHERAGVLGLIELADVRVDAELAEHPLHAERPRLVGDDRHDARRRSPCREGARRGSGRTPSWSRSRARRCRRAATGRSRAAARAAARRPCACGPAGTRRASRGALSGSGSRPSRRAACGRRRRRRPPSEMSSSKRSRKALSASSFIFFCWWVMFWPSPASPIP